MSSVLDRLRRLPTSTIVVGIGMACLAVFLVGLLGAMGVTEKNTNVAAGRGKTSKGQQAAPGDQATGASDQGGGATSGPDSGAEAAISEGGAVGSATNANAVSHGPAGTAGAAGAPGTP